MASFGVEPSSGRGMVPTRSGPSRLPLPTPAPVVGSLIHVFVVIAAPLGSRASHVADYPCPRPSPSLLPVPSRTNQQCRVVSHQAAHLDPTEARRRQRRQPRRQLCVYVCVCVCVYVYVCVCVLKNTRKTLRKDSVCVCGDSTTKGNVEHKCGRECDCAGSGKHFRHQLCWKAHGKP